MEHVALVLPTMLSFLGSELYIWRFHFGIFSGIKTASSLEGNQWPQSRRGSGSVDVGISYESYGRMHFIFAAVAFDLCLVMLCSHSSGIGSWVSFLDVTKILHSTKLGRNSWP